MACTCTKNIYVGMPGGYSAEQIREHLEKEADRKRALTNNAVSTDRSNQDRLLEAADVLKAADVYDFTPTDLIRVATYIQEN